MGESQKVQIIEVGPRDGLQNFEYFLETEQKVELIRHLVAAGLKEIQIGSFVSSGSIPQFSNMRDVAEVVLAEMPDVLFSVLVPNLRGAFSALEAGLQKVVFVLSATETHNLNNVPWKPKDSLRELRSIMSLLPKHRHGQISVDLATAFGCQLNKPVNDEDILFFAHEIFKTGVRSITLCDTFGVANPKIVRHMIAICRLALPEVTFRCHFHNTRGMALANCLVAIEEGILEIDTSIGGLGGCPHTPGTTGNAATEDLLCSLESMGINTGINLERLLGASRYLQSVLPGIEFESALHRFGSQNFDENGYILPEQAAAALAIGRYAKVV